MPLLLRLAALQQRIAVDLLQLLLQPCCAVDCYICFLRGLFLRGLFLQGIFQLRLLCRFATAWWLSTGFRWCCINSSIFTCAC